MINLKKIELNLKDFNIGDVGVGEISSKIEKI